MATVSRQIRTYGYDLTANAAVPAILTLEAPETRDAPPATFVLVFFDGPLPPGSPVSIDVAPDAHKVTVNLPSKRFGWFVDLVRNERPIFAVASDGERGGFRLMCREEPPGEGPGEPDLVD